MNYREFKELQGKSINDFPKFWAFSNKQFEDNFTEFKQKNGWVEGQDKLVSIGAGGFIKKSDVEAFEALFCNGKKQFKTFLKNPENLKDALIYELINHEYSYTGDFTDALEVLQLKFEKLTKKQLTILNEACRHVMDTCE